MGLVYEREIDTRQSKFSNAMFGKNYLYVIMYYNFIILVLFCKNKYYFLGLW